MPYSFSVREEFRRDLQEAYDWYEDQLPGLGERFVDSVEEGLSEIEDNPRAFQIVYRQARRIVLKRFPYVVYYQLEGDVIILYGCCHTSRAPTYWQQRV